MNPISQRLELMAIDILVNQDNRESQYHQIFKSRNLNQILDFDLCQISSSM